MASPKESAVHTRPAQLVVGKQRVPGTLIITHSHLRWSPAKAEAAHAPVVVVLKLITGTQKAKGQPVLRVSTGSPYKLFVFESIAERDAFQEILTPLKDAAIAAAGVASVALPSEDVQKDVFERHPDVKELHTRLVVAGIINPGEFWQSKHDLLRAAQSRSKSQRRGLSTAQLVLVRGINSAAGGTIDVNLTNEVKNQIFAESPAVKVAFHTMVPHVLSEDAFWKAYFQFVQKKLERRQKRTLTANDELLTEFEEGLKRYEAEANHARLTQRQSLKRADPTLNVAADYDDGFSGGYGTAHQAGREDSRTGKAGGRADDIMHELNQHAAVVLKGNVDDSPAKPVTPDSDAAESADVRARKAQQRHAHGLEDLQSEEAPSFIELKIIDPSKYFQRRGTEAAPAQREARPTPPQPARPVSAAPEALDPALALSALDEMMEGTSQAGGVDDEFGLPRNPAIGLIPPMLEGLRKQVLSVNELLRHFWKGFPTNTATRMEKMERIFKALQSIYDQTLAMQSAAKGMERVHVTQLLRPVLRCMDVAFSKMETEQKSKKAKTR